MNNAKRFQYLLDRIGNVKLTNVGVANGVVLPTESTYKTLYNPSIPDLGIAKITYTIDTRYNYISFDSTSHKVYLNKLTFEQYAQVKISVKFANEEKLYDGIISVDIIQGDSSATEAEIIAQVQKLVEKIDVWQNILTSRAADVTLESGDFSLPTSLSGKTITYAINPPAPECIVDNNTGKFTISLDKLKPTAQVITIKVTVGATIKDMTFTLPSAIHQDTTGFVNQNAFTSTRKQVYNQAYKENSNVQDGKNWIFINDIKKCKTLTYSANDVLTDCKGIDYFTELTSFTTTSPTSQNAINRLAGLKKLTTISAENAGIIDIFPICSLPLLTSLDVSGNSGLKNLNPILSLDLTKLTMFDARGAAITATHFTPLFDYCYNVYDNANADTLKYPSYYLGAINASVYSPAQLTNANYVSAMKYIYSVPDILELKTKYIQLPTRIMTGANSSAAITWESGDATIANIRNTTGQEIKRLRANKNGETYVKATVTVNGISFTRYFYFKVIT
ncbi:MAG: leucine-rich repeat domain-containing protein [Oscillospiraceae bacterium]